MPHSLSGTLQTDRDFDQEFHRRVIQARTHTDLWECRKVASRSKDESILRAFVAAMFHSKSHQKEISSCIREYIGKRAIPALLWNLDNLPPRQRMFQSRLLCILGYWQALSAYYRSTQELKPLDTKLNEWFLTNYATILLPGLRSSLGSAEPAFVIFCAPYLHKYDPAKVTIKLAEIARDLRIDSELRGKALDLLAAFAPEHAVDCLLDSGKHLPLPILLSSLARLVASEDGAPLLPALRHDFLQHADDRRLAAILGLPAESDEDRRVQFQWITKQLNQCVEAGVVSKMAMWERDICLQLCRAGYPEWVSYLERAAESGPLRQLARGILFGAQHSAGLRLLLSEIDAVSKPEELYGPCIAALRTYREGALDILTRVVATNNAKLRLRMEHVVAEIWKGKTIDTLLAERSVVNPPHDAPEDPAEPTEIPQPRVPRRQVRTTSSIERNRSIADQVKELEQYSCQVCGRKLVNARTGDPYAESHHVHPLGHGGSDTIDNLLCLCPLCHSLFHLGCVGIDNLLSIHTSGVGTQEKLFPQLRITSGRLVSRDAFRHHWGTLFIPPENVRFEERDPDED